MLSKEIAHAASQHDCYLATELYPRTKVASANHILDKVVIYPYVLK